VVWGLFGGFFFGSVGGLLLVARRRGGRKALIAFGPYLSAGALLFTLWPHLLDRFLVVG
jgi:prepilin signal peptidase PulO-like enzyme (type II secretory pathway)